MPAANTSNDSGDAKSPPLFSVIVPVYNGQETLAECLTAVCNQTIPPEQYEVIVIDDGSTDATPQIASRFPVRVVRLEGNCGRIVARMRGAAEAGSNLLIYCDVRVICEPTVFATALANPRRPLMYGSDCPEDWHRSLFGRFFFCLHHWLWKPYCPQEWYAPELEVTPENFEKAPKGFTFFVTEKDFYLRHQPVARDKHVNDDTLIMVSMVREKPIIRYREMRCHYQQRTDVRSVIEHVHLRGVRFTSYYIRPGHRYLVVYLAAWAFALACLAVAIVYPAWAWAIPAALAAAWVGVSALWATSPANFLAIMVCLPVVAVSFATGILRGHWTDMMRWRAQRKAATAKGSQ